MMRQTVFVLLSCLAVAWDSSAFVVDSDKKETTPALRELLSKAGAAQLSEVKVQTPVARPVSEKSGGQKISYQCGGNRYPYFSGTCDSGGQEVAL